MAAKPGVPRQMAVISGSVFHPKWQIPTRAHDPFATGHHCADAWTARLLVLMDTGKRAHDHKRQADDSSLGDRRRRLSVRLGVAVGNRPAPRTGGETYDQERRSRRLHPAASVDRPLGSWDLGDHGRCNRNVAGQSASEADTPLCRSGRRGTGRDRMAFAPRCSRFRLRNGSRRGCSCRCGPLQSQRCGCGDGSPQHRLATSLLPTQPQGLTHKFCDEANSLFTKSLRQVWAHNLPKRVYEGLVFYRPPATRIVAPVACEASSDSSRATAPATSSG